MLQQIKRNIVYKQKKKKNKKRRRFQVKYFEKFIFKNLMSFSSEYKFFLKLLLRFRRFRKLSNLNSNQHETVQ